MNVTETIDSDLTIHQFKYRIDKNKDCYLLKKISIPKEEPFSYAFIGGMWYSKNTFDLRFDEISLPFPFTTYYTIKIVDKQIQNKRARSTIYVKMPVIVLQFRTSCYLVEFDPCITIKNQDVFPFILLNETQKSYEISFYLSSTITVKEKKSAWLGKGKKRDIYFDFQKGDTFSFQTKTQIYKTWQQAITKTVKQSFLKRKTSFGKDFIEQVFLQAKNALYRSYDHKRGVFLQLPWRETPGFTFVDASYSLLSYEAVRLNYFSQWYEQTKDEDFKTWMNQLHTLFLNPEMHTRPKRRGSGIIWYNMTTLTKNDLSGYFYMDTGYSGYPGGQATIDLHLLKFLQLRSDPKLKKLVSQSLEYLLSTQKEDGSWPMAIKQEGLLKFRPEKLDEFTSHGGTAEAVRALLLGFTYFKDNRMKNAALKGLQFLSEKNPICYNGLRDIGIKEPEAFSAVSVINAFLDAYELTNKKLYLIHAKTYALYTLSWIYFWNTSTFPMKYGFHPISYSITPRLSPYETAWIISTYKRINSYTDEIFWEDLINALFSHVTSWISKTGGLSEGVFPSNFTGLERLPMEQTFATVELMNSAATLLNHSLPKKQKEKRKKPLDSSFHLQKKKNKVTLSKNEQDIFTFNASKAKITHILNQRFSNIGISFSFYGSYKFFSIKRPVKKQLRGNVGKYVLGAKDARYAVTGVRGPKIFSRIKLDLAENHLTSSNITISSEKTAIITMNLPYHSIQVQLDFSNDNNHVHIKMKIQILVKVHDLTTQQLVLCPIIGAQPTSVSDNRIDFNGFSISGDCSNIILNKSFTAINQTLATNWTHAGIFKKEFCISIPIKNTG